MGMLIRRHRARHDAGPGVADETATESSQEPTPDVTDDGNGPQAPAGNASRGDWAAYVTALGEDPGDRGRDELRDTYGPKA